MKKDTTPFNGNVRFTVYIPDWYSVRQLKMLLYLHEDTIGTYQNFAEVPNSMDVTFDVSTPNVGGFAQVLLENLPIVNMHNW